MLYICSGVTAFVALFLVGGYIWLTGYITGDGFRQASEKKLEKTLANGSSVSIPKNFGLNGFQISVPEGFVSLPKSGGNVSLQRVQTRIDWRALKDKCFSFPKVTINRLDLKITNPSKQKDSSLVIPIIPQHKTDSKPSEKHTAEVKPSHASSSPRVLIGSIAVKNGNLSYDGYSLQNAQISLTPLKENFSSWSLSLKNGVLKTPYPLLRDMSLKTLELTSEKGNYSLKKLLLSCPPGEIVLQGTYSTRKGNWLMHGRIDKLPATQFLPTILQDYFSGSLFGKVRYQGNVKGIPQIDGNLTLQDGTLKNLPFLDKLGFNFDNLRLSKASASFSYPYNDKEKNIKYAKLIDHIELESIGKIRLKGRIIIGEDDKLSGTLTVGIDQTSFNLFPKATFAAMDTIFNAHGEPGYRWVNINLSGTLNEPQEDLTARLLNLLGSGIFHSIENTTDSVLKTLSPENGATDTPSDQTQDPSSLMDKATDTASDLLQRGIQSFF